MLPPPSVDIQRPWVTGDIHLKLRDVLEWLEDTDEVDAEKFPETSTPAVRSNAFKRGPQLVTSRTRSPLRATFITWCDADGMVRSGR